MMIMNHLNKYFRNSLLIFGVVMLLAACAGGAGYSNSPVIENTPAARQAYLTTELDRVFETQQDALQPGVSAMVIKDGAVVYSRSKGMADIKQGISITSDTAFDIASVTKPVTAIAVMQLMERSLLSLNDSVLKWLPNLPSAWHSITIHHLLSHTSGIPDCCSGISLEKFQELDGLNNQQIIQRIAQTDTLLFTPGSSARYSNSNYILLSEVIAKASAMPYSDFLRLNIFDPLGISPHFYGDTPQTGKSVALNRGESIKIFGINYLPIGSDGIFASVSDLKAVTSGLLTGKLISMSSLKTMTMDHSKMKVKDSIALHYGYGWHAPVQGGGLEIFVHPGGTDGYTALLRVNYKTGVTIIQLGNGGSVTSEIMNLITNITMSVYPD
jgi:CubicO group peptidase (beta-lactamase class C family)